jgi:hypothetical protein
MQWHAVRCKFTEISRVIYFLYLQGQRVRKQEADSKLLNPECGGNAFF